MSTHTPGPWHVTPINGQPFVRNAENHNVCSLVTTVTGCRNVQNDARLIAESPAMLAALVACVSALEMLGAEGADLDAGRAAIARATEGNPHA